MSSFGPRRWLRSPGTGVSLAPGSRRPAGDSRCRSRPAATGERRGQEEGGRVVRSSPPSLPARLRRSSSGPPLGSHEARLVHAPCTLDRQARKADLDRFSQALWSCDLRKPAWDAQGVRAPAPTARSSGTTTDRLCHEIQMCLIPRSDETIDQCERPALFRLRHSEVEVDSPRSHQETHAFVQG